MTRKLKYEPLLTSTEVADIFRVDPKTVTRWVKAGRLKFIRTPGGRLRYRKRDIQGWLEEHYEPATATLKLVAA